LAVFPNPAQEKVTLKAAQANSYTIIGLEGKIWQQGQLNPDNRENEINIIQVPKGMYVLQIGGAFGVLNTKMMVAKP
jgi:Secretion system C-terminal sorting domain